MEKKKRICMAIENRECREFLGSWIRGYVDLAGFVECVKGSGGGGKSAIGWMVWRSGVLNVMELVNWEGGDV